MEFNTHFYKIDNIQLLDSSLELQFETSTNGKDVFFWKVDLIKLRENGGITIRDVKRMTNVNLPDELLEWKQNKNKIMGCLEFLEEYSAELWLREIDQAMEEEIMKIR